MITSLFRPASPLSSMNSRTGASPLLPPPPDRWRCRCSPDVSTDPPPWGGGGGAWRGRHRRCRGASGPLPTATTERPARRPGPGCPTTDTVSCPEPTPRCRPARGGSAVFCRGSVRERGPEWLQGVTVSSGFRLFTVVQTVCD